MNAKSTGRFSSKRCKKATELDAAGVVLEYQRNDPVGARHILVIAASESLQHHSFFLRDSSKKTGSQIRRNQRPDLAAIVLGRRPKARKRNTWGVEFFGKCRQ
jgi:hypothetical protein